MVPSFYDEPGGLLLRTRRQRRLLRDTRSSLLLGPLVAPHPPPAAAAPRHGSSLPLGPFVLRRREVPATVDLDEVHRLVACLGGGAVAGDLVVGHLGGQAERLL